MKNKQEQLVRKWHTRHTGRDWGRNGTQLGLKLGPRCILQNVKTTNVNLLKKEGKKGDTERLNTGATEIR